LSIADKSLHKGSVQGFESLEALNQMVSGFVVSVQGLMVFGKFVVEVKVYHSQGISDPRTILSSHCIGCEAAVLPGFSSTLRHGTGYMDSWHTPKLNAHGCC